MIVDIVNYVMLETGQPMHAFDLDSLVGLISITQSKGESFTGLDKVDRKLDDNTLIIKDDKHVLAIAGVIGGNDSAVYDNTQKILLESARFDPRAISQATRRHRTRTESSHRFERGIDPAVQRVALERVVSLIQLIMPDAVISPIAVIDNEKVPKTKSIDLPSDMIERILGLSLPHKEVFKYFQGLGFVVKDNKDGYTVTVPSHRHDVSLPIDLIEELARRKGYDQIPMELNLPLAACSLPHDEKVRVSQLLKYNGFNEAICMNILAEDVLADFGGLGSPVPLANPLNSKMTHLRHSLIPGLVQAAAYNDSRQQSRVRLFEVGICFDLDGEAIHQTNMLAGVACGEALPIQWSETSRLVDFYDIKGVITELLRPFCLPEMIVCKPTSMAHLHQGLSCDVEVADSVIGYVGVLHPLLQKRYGLSQRLWTFEILLPDDSQRKISVFSSPSKHPQVERDLALIVPKEVTFNDVKSIIQTISNGLLKSINLFDIYTGDGVPSGYKSIALRLALQHPERTLIEDEVGSEIESILHRLKEKHNISLR